MVETLEKGKTGTSLLNASDRSGKFLTFSLGEEGYGIEILKVQEIIGLMKITRIPRIPHYICGVINLRGKVIPVIDLRKRFEMTDIVDSDRNCIIVVNVSRDGTILTIGLLVDQVAEVLDLGSEQIEPPPSFGNSVETKFIFGVGKVEEKVLMLLEVDDILSADEISQATTLTHSPEAKNTDQE
ncbi:MAG: purine-binding chemotaxis protein CheW [Candidatus Omnitrophica bacterium]|nr:purine-binding chemotaxis protein CheW [Candidatus Omnitrophota bacterium]MCA9425315.1 purine-binding chemotaxis protein CheW [Candidatus Omnitrophota bacterium]MCA9434222.1 purine-binding chemotaxis protein CheW [Candidatus Omnitrophota bacterium]MCA9443644.1 purine-binding chemotaxis protein CheW [Candidatus Omnitrophota bacterium]MCA9448088.1 purine-binding chemotaxis protein CheW [Candidatus Omnitrophota bacterium]